MYRGKTADALAEIFGERAPAIRRAGAVSAAVTKIADRFGCDVIALLLSRKAHLTPQAALDLAALEPVRLRDLIGQLRLFGKLPRSWRRAGDAAAAAANPPPPLEADSTALITVPVAAPLMAQTLRDRLGRPWFADFSQIVQFLNAQPNVT